MPTPAMSTRAQGNLPRVGAWTARPGCAARPIERERWLRRRPELHGPPLSIPVQLASNVVPRAQARAPEARAQELLGREVPTRDPFGQCPALAVDAGVAPLAVHRPEVVADALQDRLGAPVGLARRPVSAALAPAPFAPFRSGSFEPPRWRADRRPRQPTSRAASRRPVPDNPTLAVTQRRAVGAIGIGLWDDRPACWSSLRSGVPAVAGQRVGMTVQPFRGGSSGDR
jgi:hypothetical protein